VAYLLEYNDIMMKKRGRRYWRNIIVATLVALPMGLCLVFYVILPIGYANGIAQPERQPVCCVMPEDAGLAYENVSFTTSDGINLRGWYLPSNNGAAVIISHGIGQNRTRHLEQGVFLNEKGFGVLLIDLRAHGESEGDMVTFGGEDIVAALDYLQTREDVDPRRIGAMGISLGGLATIQAAAVRQDIKAVVADGSAANKISDLAKPDTLMHWLDLPFQVVTYIVWEYKGVTALISTVEAIEKISPRPVLLISGLESDYERGLQRKFYQAAGEPKTLWEVPGAGHAQGWTINPQEYKQRILDLFTQALLSGEQRKECPRQTCYGNFTIMFLRNMGKKRSQSCSFVYSNPSCSLNHIKRSSRPLSFKPW
jgi:fermentation-respiration switch protein FrsA (DUF1100 family)